MSRRDRNRIRHTRQFLNLVAADEEDTEAIRPALDQVLAAWDRADDDPDTAVAFTLAMRRFCDHADLQEEYVRHGEHALSSAAGNDRFRLLISLGQAHGALWHWDTALGYFRRTLSELGPQDDPDFRGFALNNIGRVQAATDDYRGAVRSYIQAIKAFTTPDGDREGLATALSNLGHAHSRLGNRQEALDLLERALDEAPYDDVRAPILRHLGWTHADLGHSAEAVERNEQALALYQRLGDDAGHASTLNSLALLHHQLGDPRRALAMLHEAAEIEAGLPPTHDRVTTIGNLATIHADLGETDKAETYFLRVLAAALAAGSRESEAIAHNNIGLLRYRSGDKNGAVAEFDLALPLFTELGLKEGIAAVYANRGLARLDRDDIEEALRLHREISDVNGEGQTLNTLGLIHQRDGDDEEALRCHERALAIHEETGDLDEQATSLVNLSVILERRGDTVKAAGLLRRAIRIEEQIDSPELAEHREALDQLERG
ncbi:tetratricopeptide repeat protein [Verrucosispora sp. WMMA2121]|uniref:tetratricopeptide repeat protein n=1 Tax=Verrucosispora sp. WMMA2121 TaxID=3015164 RepID=UPI0022B69064|nr:tetratricopeptide repeat protein [Verrucosispora sp. WMMA2121]MCZ7421205.1 tetratricopeptide repeat protein [Verrucosispora sp. WMMA2121]